MTNEPQATGTVIKTSDKNFEIVNNFKYLGTTLTYNNISVEIMNRFVAENRCLRDHTKIPISIRSTKQKMNNKTHI